MPHLAAVVVRSVRWAGIIAACIASCLESMCLSIEIWDSCGLYRWAARAQLRDPSQASAVILPCTNFADRIAAGPVTDFDLQRTVTAARKKKASTDDFGLVLYSEPEDMTMMSISIPGSNLLRWIQLLLSRPPFVFVTAQVAIGLDPEQIADCRVNLLQARAGSDRCASRVACMLE